MRWRRRKRVDCGVAGIKAATPSAFSTPCGANSFTPTATPCNSPDGSPTRSRCQSPEPFSIPQLILSSVPQFIKDTVVGGGAKKKMIKSKRSKTERAEVNNNTDFAHFFLLDLIFNTACEA